MRLLIPAAKRLISPALGLTAIVFIFSLEDSANGVFMGSNFIRQPPSCVDIPDDLKLCENVGYNRMILPNLLNHESLSEVRQQASSFVPLLGKRCHPHLQEFLCSLFAPVCLPPDSAVPGPIPPCRSLCRSVEGACTPVMNHHNFDWPSMLNCSKFPDQEPCVKIEAPTAITTPVSTGASDLPNITTTTSRTQIATTATNSNICAPCGTTLEIGTLHDNYCASEFVLKIKIKRTKAKKSKGIREIVADRRRRVIYKTGPLTKRDIKRLKLIVNGSRRCVCPALDTPNVPAASSSRKKKKKSKSRKNKKIFYLVMGRKVESKFLVTVLHSWPKRNRVLKKASKTNFGAATCPEFGNPDMS